MTEGSPGVAADRMDVAELVQAPPFQRSNPSAQIPPFPILMGEHPVLLSKTTDGNAMVTNHRFCVCERRSFINIPLTMIGELFVIEATKRLRIGCKDGSTYSCTFATTEDCNICTAVLKERTGQPRDVKDIFAYRFYTVTIYKNSLNITLSQSEMEQIALCQPVSEAFGYTFGKEVERLGFDTSRRRIWRMSLANEKYEFCPTYPKYHILPASVDDDKLKFSLDFRAMKRFPSVVWRDKSSGVVLIRSSQPLSSFLGLSYFHNPSDVTLIEEIVNACNMEWKVIVEQEKSRALLEPEVTTDRSPGREQGGNSNGNSVEENGAQGSLVVDDSRGANGHGASNGLYDYDESRFPRKLAIVDCRSLAGVWGNSFKGGGTEDEVVYKCNIIHLDLANIHNVRDSFIKLRQLCHTYVEGTYFKTLSGCLWLTYISALLRGAQIVVELMHVKKRPVLVHCSDGWDRTSQIVSLSELMMDPYYRTLEGFQVLVEREWLHFGHKFGERGGHDPNCSDTNQVSPIFLQFLDCVYQLTLQYPAEFQFNEAYLVKLLKHSQACLFGNFLHNCQKERESCQHKTASIWSLLRPENTQFVNLLYKPTVRVLTAKYSEHDIVLWKSVYMAGLSPWPNSSQTDFFLDSPAGSGEETGNTAAEGMPRSKSMDDLTKVTFDSGRRNSDPSITQSQESAAAAHVLTGIHDTSSSSAEILHYPEDSPPTGAKTAHTGKPEENGTKDFPRKTSADASTSTNVGPISESGSLIPHTGASDSKESPGLVTAQLPERNTPPLVNGVDTDHSQKAVNGLDADSSERPAQEAPLITAEQSCAGSEHPHAQISKMADSIIQEGADALSTNSRAQMLGPGSSAVFCQDDEESVGSEGERTLCEDQEGSRTISHVLSSETKLSTSVQGPPGQSSVINGSVAGGSDVRKSRSYDSASVKVMDSGFVASSPQKASSNSDLSSANHYLRHQTSLLAERLAVNGDTNGIVNGFCSNSSDKMGHMNGEIHQHSKKSEDSADLRARLKAKACQKLRNDSSGHSNSYSNGRSGKQSSRATVNDVHFSTSTSPSNVINTQMPNGNDCARTNVNSASTDTLTDELETGGGDSTSPTSSLYSRPLEVSTKQDRFMATPPLPSSSSSSLLSSPLKKEGFPDSTEVTTGSGLLSRRARAASGASRDLSVSPCACRGNWSDTGRLRNPSGGELASRRWIGATVATSTTDISDSYVGKLTTPAVDRQPSIKQHIDVDGLTLFCDERQDLLTELVSEKDRKIYELENRLLQAIEIIKAARSRQLQQQALNSALMDEFLPNDSDGGEMNSLGAHSNAASDASWETIEETEAKMVYWVPDSAVTHCAGCDGLFWLARRKHHCRNCGKIFCSECSNYMAPVPEQHLNKPERVCRRCHSHLLQLSPGASSDGRIPTLVADG